MQRRFSQMHPSPTSVLQFCILRRFSWEIKIQTKALNIKPDWHKYKTKVMIIFSKANLPYIIFRYNQILSNQVLHCLFIREIKRLTQKIIENQVLLQQLIKRLIKIYYYMQKLGEKTLNQIEKLITTKNTDKRPDTSPTRARNKKSAEKQTRKKTLVEQKQKISPENSPSPYKRTIIDYHPLQKQNKLMQRQIKMVYQDLDYQRNQKVKNKHSFFLNSKNPKPPIYQRAKQIVQQREMILSQKRKEIQRQREQREDQQYQKFLAEVPPKKVISKNQAYDISERLYKDHYAKLHRMNSEKMQRMKKQTYYFREKPEINQNSIEIFSLLKDKIQIQEDVFNRMDKYAQERSRKHQQMQKSYKKKYLPFKPVISQNSRLIIEAKIDRDQLSRSKHCNSCIWLKSQKSHTNLTSSPSKSSIKKPYLKQSPLKVSQFE